MVKRLLYVFVIISLFVFLTAMGGGGGGFEKAPRVDKNYSVIVTDLSGNKIEGEKFSWEGRTHFSGYMGMAQVSIPFEKAKTLTLGDKKERKVKVSVQLTDGKVTDFEIDANSRCYGEAGFGSFMLRMDEIKTISFK